jgi:hypothetical protein
MVRSRARMRTDSCAVGGRVNLRHLPTHGVLSGKAAGMVADGGHSGADAKIPGGAQRYRTDTDGFLILFLFIGT